MNYKEMLEDRKISTRQIMERLDMPQRFYKYRKFIDLKDENIETYWKEALNGEMFFSLPTAFNSNDDNDCILVFQKEICLKEISKLLGLSKEKVISSGEWDKIEKIIKNDVRENIKIGCFTTGNQLDTYMWKCEEFGANHTGFCIEYNIKNSNWNQEMIFLPVYYDKKYIDMTDVILDLINYTYKLDDIRNHSILIRNGVNFTLSKLEKYQREKEWRIIVIKNHWHSFFDIDGQSKKDFSRNIKAVYLGANYKQLDNFKLYKDYALKVCEEKGIPLYEMYWKNKTELMYVQIN